MQRVLGFLACVYGATFPVTEVSLTLAEFSELTNGTAAQKEALATSKILPGLRIFFNKTAHAIQIDTSDIVISETLPDEKVDTSCDHEVTAEHPKVTGSVANTSYLQFGVSHIGWKGVSVFADARVDAGLEIDSDVKVEIGKKVLGHCEHLGHKTVGVNVYSTGHNGVGLNMTASHAHIVHTSTGYDLVFNFSVDVVGLVLDWNVDDVVAHNCKIEILGIKIGSYCGLIEKAIKSGMAKLTTDVSKVVAPNLEKKLQTLINTAIGSQVSIPIKLPTGAFE